MFNLIKTYGKLKTLFLDGLLQFDVIFIGNIQRQFEFGDLNLQLLLDASDFSFQFSFSFDDSGAKLLDFDAGLLPVEKQFYNLIRTKSDSRDIFLDFGIRSFCKSLYIKLQIKIFLDRNKSFYTQKLFSFISLT